MAPFRKKAPSWGYGKPRYQKGGKAKRRLKWPTKKVMALGVAPVYGYRHLGNLFPRRTVSRRNTRTAGFLGMESKFLDCAWNGVTISTSTTGADGELQPSSGCTAAISVPGQGDGESQRDGRKYTITSAYFSGMVNTGPLQDQADVGDFFGYYFAMVLDTQANAATIVSENVYINPSTLATAMLPYPLRNLQNSKRFRILDSAYVPVGGAYAVTDGASTSSSSNMTSPQVKLSWSGAINVECVGTTADVASCSNNAIHILAFAGASSLTPVMVAKSRIRFLG